MKKNVSTICPLPWMHLSIQVQGYLRLCCNGDESITPIKEHGQRISIKNISNLKSVFNSECFKDIRLKMLNGERPEFCNACFDKEDHGVKSIREVFLEEYMLDMPRLLKGTNDDGSIDNPEILYLDMAMGNKCNLKCRMCTPWNSYPILNDWKKMGIKDGDYAKDILKNTWYEETTFFNLLKEILPNLKAIFLSGGEPMIIKGHQMILEMIVEEGHADHIRLRYNSNHTIIPTRVIELWDKFKEVVFNCSIEAYGALNDYIRYPSKWDHQVKNLIFLDQLAGKNKHIDSYIHTTLQSYNIARIPEFLTYLRYATYIRNIRKVPHFIWVFSPKWLSPCIFPEKMRNEIANKILDSLEQHSDFFKNSNEEHFDWNNSQLDRLRQFTVMLKKKSSEEKHLKEFVEYTRGYDRIRKQSVTKVLPELKKIFADN